MEKMKRTIRFLTLLAVMMVTAGQARAEALPQGYIYYDPQTTGGRLRFFSTEAAAFANINGASEGNISIPTDVKKSQDKYSGTIYIRAVHAGCGYTINGMTINVEVSTGSGQAQGRRRATPAVGEPITVTPVEGHTGVYKFDMPSDGSNVTVTAAFAANPAVETKYIDADGTEKTVQAFPLDGAEDQLGAFETKWYVASGTVAYDHTLNIYGEYQDNVHIILADGCNMTVTAAYTAIEFASYDLTLNIYGQSGDTGSLTATGTGSGLTYGIGKYANEATADLIINGGQVTANGGTGIEATNVTINGGQVTSTGSSNGISAGNDITINGGQVTSNGDIYADNITLGWTDATNFIKATSYNGTVKTAAGKLFNIDGTTTIIGGDEETTISDLTTINGKKLVPTKTIATGGEKYLDICITDGDWKLPPGMKAYVVTGIDLNTCTVTLSEAPLEGLPAGVPVILVPEGSTLPTTINLTGTNAKEAAAIENSLNGKNPTPMFTFGNGISTMKELIANAANKDAATVNTGDYLVFTLENSVFKVATLNPDSKPGFGKCFLVLDKWLVVQMINNINNTTATVRNGIPFDFGGTTGISGPTPDGPTPAPSLYGGEWYDLQGRKLDKQPTEKGVYIQGGKKRVVK